MLSFAILTNRHNIMACVNPLLACSRLVSCCCVMHTGGSPTCVPFSRLRRTALFGRVLRFLLSFAAGGYESQCRLYLEDLRHLSKEV